MEGGGGMGERGQGGGESGGGSVVHTSSVIVLNQIQYLCSGCCLDQDVCVGV